MLILATFVANSIPVASSPNSILLYYLTQLVWLTGSHFYWLILGSQNSLHMQWSVNYLELGHFTAVRQLKPFTITSWQTYINFLIWDVNKPESSVLRIMQLTTSICNSKIIYCLRQTAINIAQKVKEADCFDIWPQTQRFSSGIDPGMYCEVTAGYLLCKGFEQCQLADLN